MRVLYDSITAANIPANAQLVAGYIDGRYAWSFADWQRFPNAIKVRIAVFASTNAGTVLDVERGDATPAQAVGWVQRRRAAGVDPTVYCGYSTNGYSWALVIDAFKSAGVPEPHWWIAAYPGIGPVLYPGSVAHQYADPGPYDLSVVADYWPGVDSLLKPPGDTTVGNTLTTGGTVTDVPTVTPPVPLTPHVQEDDMLALIIWCYVNLVGRDGTVDEIASWVKGSAGLTSAQVLDRFLDSPPEAASVVKAFDYYIGATPTPEQVAQYVVPGNTIRSVRTTVKGSLAALNRKA